MKYENIGKLLGWTETPDAEELHLQPEEAAAINAAFATLTTAEETAGNLVAANETIQTLTGEVDSLKTAATAATTTATTQANRIAELEGQVAELGKQSSGDGGGTKLKTTGDPIVTEEKPTPSWMDDKNPANQFADKRIKRTTA